MHCNELLNNIAHIQTEIAHLLHEEANNLEKTVSSSNHVCDLLDANYLVIDVIKEVTDLQYVIYHQLKEFLFHKETLDKLPSKDTYYCSSCNKYHYY